MNSLEQCAHYPASFLTPKQTKDQMMDEGSLIALALAAVGRYTYSDDDRLNAVEIFKRPDLNWTWLLATLFRNKIAGLAYYNLHRLGLPSALFAREALRLYYRANIERNRVVQERMHMLLNSFGRAGVDVRPLKGAVLIPAVYTDLGSRFVNDIDFFIRRDDQQAVRAVMAEAGYVQGNPKSDGSLEPYSREERVLWSLKMFNMMPFVARTDHVFAPVVAVDFAFGLSFEDGPSVSEKVMSEKGKIAGIDTLSLENFFVHLCSHLFKEATMEATVELHQDINLIKFTDVREFLRAFGDQMSIPTLRRKAAELGATRAIYYALASAAEAFSEDALVSLLPDLGIDFTDDQSLHVIRRQGGSVVGIRSKSIKQSMVDV